MSNPMADSKGPAKKIIPMALIALSGVFIVGIGALFLHMNKPAFLSLSLPQTETVEVTFEQGGNAIPLIRSEEGFTVPAGVHLSDRYTLSTTIQKDGAYRDIVLTRDPGANVTSIKLSGFDPGGAFRLTQDNKTILDGLHFDWSGRITVTTTLPEGEAAFLCMETAPSFTLCHTVEHGGQV